MKFDEFITIFELFVSDVSRETFSGFSKFKGEYDKFKSFEISKFEALELSYISKILPFL